MTADTDTPALMALDEFLAYTGLNRNALHQWERRYGLLPAERNAAGRRFYTLEQAERFRKLKLCSDAGHRISQVVALPEEALDQLVREERPVQSFRELIDAARLLDHERVAGLLRIRLRSQGTRRWLLETVIPLLRQVGALWSEAQLPIAGEHVISLGVKQVLVQCLHDTDVTVGATVAVVTTLDGEQHEFGALAAALLARLEGVMAHYLGPSLPVREIAAAASRLKASHVMVGSLTLPAETASALVGDLRALLPADVTLVVGGSAARNGTRSGNLIPILDLEALPEIFQKAGHRRQHQPERG